MVLATFSAFALDKTEVRLNLTMGLALDHQSANMQPPDYTKNYPEIINAPNGVTWDSEGFSAQMSLRLEPVWRFSKHLGVGFALNYNIDRDASNMEVAHYNTHTVDWRWATDIYSYRIKYDKISYGPSLYYFWPEENYICVRWLFQGYSEYTRDKGWTSDPILTTLKDSAMGGRLELAYGATTGISDKDANLDRALLEVFLFYEQLGELKTAGIGFRIGVSPRNQWDF